MVGEEDKMSYCVDKSDGFSEDGCVVTYKILMRGKRGVMDI